jgi:hypothetical protein
MAISSGLWVSALLKSLLASGVVDRATDGRHLTLKPGLSKEQENTVEWLHIGIINFVYGDLVEVSDYVYDRQLKPHWYYRRS